MRSPFQIFRKYQKEATVVLIGMALLAFIILDSISQMSKLPSWMWIGLLGLALGGIFWVFGTRAAKSNPAESKGKALEYALGGTALGVAIGVSVMMFTRPAPAVSTSVGKISEAELQKMVERRRDAVNFMEKAYRAAKPMPEGRIQQFLWNRGLIEATFGQRSAGFSAPIRREDVVVKFLLLEEAKKYDIRVSDTAIQEHIKRVCKGLSPRAYESIRQELGLSEKDLMNLLREELTAQLVRKIKFPSRLQVSPPLAYWRQYKKYNVSQKLESVELNVSDFTSKLPKPTDSELQALFNKYKEELPSQELKPTPAFKLPDRIQIAYIRPDADQIRSDVIRKLESEIVPKTERVAKLKEIADAVADVRKKIKEGKIKKEDAEKELSVARQSELARLLKFSEPNRLQYEIVKYYEENKEFEFSNPAWAKAFPEKKKPVKRIGPVVAPRPKRKAAKTTPKKTGAFQPAMPSRLVASLVGASPVGLMTALLQPKTGKKKPNTKTNDAKTKADPKKNPFNADDEIKGPEEPPLPVDPVRPFRPLDDVIREMARQRVIDGRVTDEIAKRMTAAAAEMDRWRDEYLRAIDAKKAFDGAAASSALSSKAKELGLQYVVTTNLGVGRIEFMQNPDKYPMATDTGLVSSFTQPQFSAPRPRLVVTELYANRTKQSYQLYRVIRAMKYNFNSQLANNPQIAANPQFARFLYQPVREQPFLLWKTAHMPAEVPKFNEPGVREKVVKAWQQIEARKLAEKRGNELAEMVRNSKKPMEILFEDATVSGEKAGKALSPTTTRQFSWLSIQKRNARSPVPSRGLPQIERIFPSPIAGVVNPGEDFRTRIFNEMNEGDVAVIPNVDKSRYYVVRVFDRTPTTAAGLLAARKQMVKSEELFQPGQDPNTTPYYEINSPMNSANRKLAENWRKELFERYEVKGDFSEDDER